MYLTDILLVSYEEYWLCILIWQKGGFGKLAESLFGLLISALEWGVTHSVIQLGTVRQPARRSVSLVSAQLSFRPPCSIPKVTTLKFRLLKKAKKIWRNLSVKVKVNSVKEACAKFFAVHISEFKILETKCFVFLMCKLLVLSWLYVGQSCVV